MILPNGVKVINQFLPNRYLLIKNTVKCMTTSMEKEQKIVVNKQTINYIKVGNGQNKVLCFPGALGSIWSDFKPQIESLDRQKFTIFAWDPPGYGHSQPPKRSFNLDFYKYDAEMAHELMMKLGINKFSLLGWSDGGISSIILSSEHPDHVEKLVIWGANSYVLPEEIKSYEKIRDVSKWSDKMKTPLIKLYTEKGLQDLWSNWCDTLITIQKNGGDICKNNLKSIKCPTLILHGDKDPMVAPEHPQYLLSHIKNAKLHRFPEGKHNIHLKYATEFNQIISNFLLN